MHTTEMALFVQSNIECLTRKTITFRVEFVFSFYENKLRILRQQFSKQAKINTEINKMYRNIILDIKYLIQGRMYCSGKKVG